MSWSNLTHEQRKTIAEKYRRGESLEDDAAATGMKEGTLGRCARAFLSDEAARVTAVAASVAIPAAQAETYNQALVVEADNAVIISDLEIPDHDAWLVAASALTGLQYGIDTLIIAGDLVATDQQALTDWTSVHSAEGQHGYRRVIDSTKKLLVEYLKVFSRIFIIEGNHDDRIARRTQGEVDLGMFLDMPNVTYSRYRYMWLRTARGYYYISHPQNYSASSVALGQRLYNTHVAPDGSKAHIVLAHTHQAQEGFSPDGTRRIFALGTARDKEKTRYKATGSNSMPEWSQSFLLIEDGYGDMLYRHDTNWKRVLPGCYDLLK